MKRLIISMSLILGSVLNVAYAAEDSNDAIKRIGERLTEAVPGIKVVNISESPIPGLYEVESNNPQPIYVSEDGQYFVAGEIYQIKGNRIANLTEERREKARAELLSKVSESEMVVFKPEKVKAKVAVFTDVDCGYCRKLHQEVNRMNELGIQVNYLAYPRAGIGSNSYKKIVSVWCADDQKEAMNLAKQGKSPDAKDCENPVADQFDLGGQMGVTGTPAILLEDGRLIPGYVPADSLAKGLGIAVTSN